MAQENTDFDFLICPFTGRNLRLLSDAELKDVNAKIEANELFFYPGVQVEKPLKRALVTEHQTYIYPICDDILFLKKETAIVSKNRTENYLKRVSDHVISYFNNVYGFNEDGQEEGEQARPTASAMPSDEVALLKQRIPNSSNIFLTIASDNVDDVHNLVFNSKFDKYVHADFDLERLKSVKGELQKDTILVLCENVNLPFAEDAIDAMILFDQINQYDKENQVTALSEVSRVMNPEGASVILFDDSKPLAAESQLKKQQLVRKAQGLLKPWKKINMPTVHFHPVKGDRGTGISSPVVGKTSFKRQLF